MVMQLVEDLRVRFNKTRLASTQRFESLVCFHQQEPVFPVDQRVDRCVFSNHAHLLFQIQRKPVSLDLGEKRTILPRTAMCILARNNRLLLHGPGDADGWVVPFERVLRRRIPILARFVENIRRLRQHQNPWAKPTGRYT